MTTRPRPQAKKSPGFVRRKAAIPAFIAIVVLLAAALDPFSMGSDDLPLFWVALLAIFGAAFLYMAREMQRTGYFYYNDVNYPWRLRRSERPVAFRVVQATLIVFGVALIALSLAFVIGTERGPSSAALGSERSAKELSREQAERAKRTREQLEQRLQGIQRNPGPQ